jgi:hypothetical protein
MKEMLGGLLEFENDEKFIEFVETMNMDMAIRIAEGSLDYGQKNGLYTLEESYCIYKCLSILKHCVNDHGSGFKGPSKVATVELDEDEKNELTN